MQRSEDIFVIGIQLAALRDGGRLGVSKLRPSLVSSSPLGSDFLGGYSTVLLPKCWLTLAQVYSHITASAVILYQPSCTTQVVGEREWQLGI
jgi:hypothetical protein